MKRFILVFIGGVALLVGACDSENEFTSRITPLDSFITSVELPLGECVIDNLVNPQGVDVRDSLILIRDNSLGRFASIYGMSGFHIVDFVHRGRGPGETSNLLKVSFCNDSVICAMIASETLLYYNVNELLDGKVLPYNSYTLKNNYAFSTIAPCNDSTIFFVGKNLQDKSNSTRFCICNTHNDDVVYWGEFPSQDEVIKAAPADDYTRQTIYQGWPQICPDKTKIVTYYYYALGFDIITMDNLQVNSVFYQYSAVKPEYIPQLGINVIRENKDALCGFLDAACTNQGIYLLYSGKCFADATHDIGRYILHYDWVGNPIQCYKLPIEVDAFCIDESGNNFYVCYNNESYGEILRISIK